MWDIAVTVAARTVSNSTPRSPTTSCSPTLPTSPIGEAMFALVGVLAEVERAWTIERTHAGLRRARAQGKRLRRPRVITDTGKLRQLLATGVSHRAAARVLKVSEGSVRRAAQHAVTPKRSS